MAGGSTNTVKKPEKEEKEPTQFEIMADRAKFIATTPQFLQVFFGTWLCFLITLLLFAYGYMNHSTTCWMWVFVALVWITSATLTHIFIRPGQVTAALSTGCFLALVIGTICGMYVYDTAAIFPLFYEHARKYTNVVSSEPSAAVADAGKLVFNQDTRVDPAKSVGYTREDGTVYCVAPVMDPSNQPRIEYWAAGLNCCAQSGDFKCDASANAKAQGGVVIFDNNGWFSPARYPYYQKARAKAEAQFMLQSVGEPIFVRWVEKDNLDMLANEYGTKALWNIMIMLVFFGILSALLAFGMWQPRSLISK